jgi:predicted DNA binding protein
MEERKEAESLLTEKQLEAARLHYTMGFNQYEIAKILGISQKAVDYRLNGAEAKVGKKRIRVLLDPAVMAAY